MVHIAKYLGENLEVNIKIDAKPTMGTLHRQRPGRLKHVDTNARWSCRRRSRVARSRWTKARASATWRT